MFRQLIPALSERYHTIAQNGNACIEGLSDGWNPIRTYWNDPSKENRNALKMMTDPGTAKWQYVHGFEDESLVAPESYTLDQHSLDRPGISPLRRMPGRSEQK